MKSRGCQRQLTFSAGSRPGCIRSRAWLESIFPESMVLSRHGIHHHFRCIFDYSNARTVTPRRAGNHPALAKCPRHTQLWCANSDTKTGIQYHVREHAFRVSSSNDVRLPHINFAGGLVLCWLSLRPKVVSYRCTFGKASSALGRSTKLTIPQASHNFEVDGVDMVRS